MRDRTKARILIVDDRESNTLLLGRILQAAGYAPPRSLTDPRRVAAAYQEWDPHLIVLDLMMPFLDGFGVMNQLKPLVPAGGHLPILVVTADANPAVRQRALAGGAKDFLTKPIDAVEVVLRVNNLLETHFLYRRLRRRNRLLKEKVRQRSREVREQAALIAKARDAILVRDLDDRITFWNEGAERLYGWARAEAVGSPAGELLGGEAALETEASRETLARGEWAGELRQRTRGGDAVTVHSHWTLIRDGRGKPKSKLVINTDVTEMKQLEAQFLHAQRMEGIGRLAGGVAHDFNNLLTVITGCSELVLGQLAPGDPARGLVGEIHKAGDRATGLTRQLLAFSRRQVLNPVVLDLNALLVEIQTMLRRLLGEDLTLTSSLDPASGRVKVDPGQIEQVLINLAVNARDAMPGGGRLTIETRNVELAASSPAPGAGVRPGPYVRLTVADTGCGMDAATRARIFEPFFTTKEVGKGTGLGLATVYGIVKQSGGHVEVDSEVGRGTAFHVYLPRVCDALPPDEPVSGGLVPACRGSETVLLAEDEDGVRTVSRLALQSAGYRVLEARDGDHAGQVSRGYDGPIHLLVTDVVMPKRSGRELADLLRPLRPEMKVLFLSGYTDDVAVRHGAREAEVAFLQKPFTPAVLARKVREVLGG